MACQLKKDYKTLNYNRFILCNNGPELDPEMLKSFRNYYGISQQISTDITIGDCIQLVEQPEHPVFIRKMPLQTILKVTKVENTFVTCADLESWPQGTLYTFRIEWLQYFRRVLNRRDGDDF
jgi:hypothetical protein